MRNRDAYHRSLMIPLVFTLPVVDNFGPLNSNHISKGTYTDSQIQKSEMPWTIQRDCEIKEIMPALKFFLEITTKQDLMEQSADVQRFKSASPRTNGQARGRGRPPKRRR